LLGISEAVLAEVRDQLGRQFSHIDIESPVLKSADTGYYKNEMGETILRQWVCTHNLFFVPQLVEIKRSTHQIELQRCIGMKRTVNIDPGYVTANKVVRATSRDAAHRLYMNRGIYVESVLIAEDAKVFSPWPWTDADFRTETADRFFHDVRNAFMRQLSQEAGDD
jgi:hypothetical protein